MEEIRRKQIIERLPKEIWVTIGKLLDVKSMVHLGATCNYMHDVTKEEELWKCACIRDLRVKLVNHQLPKFEEMMFTWFNLYRPNIDGRHSFTRLNQRPKWSAEQHYLCARIGAFIIESPTAVALWLLLEQTRQFDHVPTLETLLTYGFHVENMRTGLWIADQHLFRCNECMNCSHRLFDCLVKPVNIFEARHIELLLNGDYDTGYQQIGAYDFATCSEVLENLSYARAIVIDATKISNCASHGLFEIPKYSSRQRQAKVASHGSSSRVDITGMSAALDAQDRFTVEFYVKTAADGKVISIRIIRRHLNYFFW